MQWQRRFDSLCNRENRVVKRLELTHFGDVLEGEIGVVDVLFDFGHESVGHVVLAESLDLQGKNVNIGVKGGATRLRVAILRYQC